MNKQGDATGEDAGGHGAWSAQLKDELKAIGRRRRRVAPSLDEAQADPSHHDRSIPLAGLALSGGGVRSATFSLGLLRGLAKGGRTTTPSATANGAREQPDVGPGASPSTPAKPSNGHAEHPAEQLSRQGLLGRFDYLSSVSGGGYVAAMLGRLAAKAECEPTPSGDCGMVEAERTLASHDGNVLSWLRRNGRYLSPGGSRDIGIVVVTYVRALLAIHLEFMVFCLMWGLLVITPHLWQYSTQVLSSAWKGWYSPWVALSAGLLMAVGPGLIAGYWFTRDTPRPDAHTWRARVAQAVQWLMAVALVALVLWMRRDASAPAIDSLYASGPSAYAVISLMIGSVLLGQALCWLALVHPRMRRSGNALAAARLRNWLTRALHGTGVAAVLLLALGVLDAASWWLLQELMTGSNAWWGGIGAGGVGILLLRSFAQPLQQLAADTEGHAREWLPKLLGVLSAIGMLCLVMAWLVTLQWLVFAPDSIEAISSAPPLLRAVFVLLACLAWIALTSTNTHMPNSTSLHAFYRARLTRAYLAVGNPTRLPWRGLGRERSVRNVVEGDDGLLAHYRPEDQGGPIHLINACLNETRDSDSNLYNADRKGALLTVSWRGMEVGPSEVHRHASPEQAGTVGQWVAVSGAAASPGAGAYTSRGLALLLYFLGIRLGFWIASPIRTPGLRWLSQLGWDWFPKPLMLTCEATATFMGQERPWWYVSDGGHFDNTGVYPLIKRELDFIMLSDASSDRHFQFNDLENLVRKARIDFGAEIDFYTREEASRLFTLCGTDLTVLSPEDLRDNTSRRGLLLARIRYRERPDPSRPGQTCRPEGTLVVIKPNLHNALDVDVLSYAERNPTFPHEATSDQFFDEAQWESYHRLGEDIGQALTETWLAQLPGWRHRARHAVRVSARLNPAVVAQQASPEPLWRRGPRGAALKTTLGLGASGTLLLSGWQIVESMNVQQKEARAQARELFVKVSTELQGFDRQCKAIPEHVINQAESLMLDVVRSDTLSSLDRGSVHRMSARIRESCQPGAEVWQGCTPQASQDRQVFCAAMQRPPATATAMNYWVAPQRPEEQYAAALALLNRWTRDEPSDTAFAQAPPPAATNNAPVLASTEGLPDEIVPAAGPTPGDHLAQACPTRAPAALLYVQIYDEAARNIAEDLRRKLNAQSASPWMVPPVDNVVQRSSLQGQRGPVPWPRPTIVVHRESDMACAEGLREWLRPHLASRSPGSTTDAAPAEIWIRRLPPTVKGRDGVFELWLPAPQSAAIGRQASVNPLH